MVISADNIAEKGKTAKKFPLPQRRMDRSLKGAGPREEMLKGMQPK